MQMKSSVPPFNIMDAPTKLVRHRARELYREGWKRELLENECRPTFYEILGRCNTGMIGREYPFKFSDQYHLRITVIQETKLRKILDVVLFTIHTLQTSRKNLNIRKSTHSFFAQSAAMINNHNLHLENL